MDLFPAHGDAYPAYRYYRYGGLVSRQPYEMDFMGGDSMDLPYLAVDGHARMALCSGWCWRYYSAYYCVGRSRNAEDYAFFKGLNNF